MARPTDGDLDLATPASGIGGTTLCQDEAPIRKTLRTEAGPPTAEAVPTTIPRRPLLLKITRLTLRKHIKPARMMTTAPERRKWLLLPFHPTRYLQLNQD